MEYYLTVVTLKLRKKIKRARNGLIRALFAEIVNLTAMG